MYAFFRGMTSLRLGYSARLANLWAIGFLFPHSRYRTYQAPCDLNRLPTAAIPEMVALEPVPGSGGVHAPKHQGCACSKHRFYVRAHHSFNSADTSVLHELVHREFSDSLAIIPQRFHRNIYPDFVPILEAVRNRLFIGIDLDWEVIHNYRFDPTSNARSGNQKTLTGSPSSFGT
jgi:hypothetical protein